MRIIKVVNKQICINDINYDVEITYKTGKKNISYRFKDNKFIISAPALARYDVIEKYLIKFAPRLVKLTPKKEYFTDEYVYIFGDRYDLSGGVLTLKTGETFTYKDKADLTKKLKKYYLNVITLIVHEYMDEMDIKDELKIHVKEMSTRYGSFSRKTNGLSFAFSLIHYDIEMSKSVIVHELSHYFVFNHSQKFYDKVLKYYPNYYFIHQKLRKGILR